MDQHLLVHFFFVETDASATAGSFDCFLDGWVSSSWIKEIKKYHARMHTQGGGSPPAQARARRRPKAKRRQTTGAGHAQGGDRAGGAAQAKGGGAGKKKGA